MKVLLAHFIAANHDGTGRGNLSHSWYQPSVETSIAVFRHNVPQHIEERPSSK